MRSFESKAKLGKGLSTEDCMEFASEGLHGCVNLYPQKDYLTLFEKPEKSAIKMDYPFPQYWAGNKFTFLVNRFSIVINDVIKIDNKESLFSFVDFNDFVLAISNKQILYYNVESGEFIVNDLSNPSSIIPMSNSMINYKGQLLLGGITEGFNNYGKNFICWSKIGLADFTLDLSNESGYTVLQSVKEVYKLLLLGDHIIAYTDTGIFKGRPTGLAYSFVRMTNITPMSKNTIMGNYFSHLFMASDGYWYQITEEKFEKLGYKWMEDVLDVNKISIFIHPSNQDFYITDGMDTFILNSVGLFQTTVILSSFVQDLKTSTISYIGNDVDDIVLLETSWIDFGRVGFKTLEALDILIHPKGLNLKVDCIGKSYPNTLMKIPCSLNDNYCASPIITSNCFKIRISIPYTKTKSLIIQSLNLRHKFGDRRNYRAGGGTYETNV